MNDSVPGSASGSTSHGESSITINLSSDGRVCLVGELSFETVPGLSSAIHRLLNDNGDSLNVDLEGIHRTDSAGVALLIEWQRQALKQNRSIHIHNIPQQMLAIARLSGMEEILSLSI